MFNEPSTRTRSSFELAEKRLSCDTMAFGGTSTSTVKGESLVDTVKTLCSYKIDCIVVRDKHAGAPYKIAQTSGLPVIDAGDGKHQHPTQALLDLYSIWERKGSFEGLHVGIVGDINHSRVCGSLIPALKIMGATVTVTGTTVSTITDMDGKFTIVVPDGYSTVTVSYSGMKKQVVSIQREPIMLYASAEKAQQAKLAAATKAIKPQRNFKRNAFNLEFSYGQLGGDLKEYYDKIYRYVM